MAVASGVASADGGERDEDNRQTHEDSLVVLGNHDNTYYLFGTTGDIDHGWTAEDSDDQITSFSGDKVQGFIGDGGRDGFGFNGQIKYVHIRGDATIIVDFDNVNF